MRKLPLHWKIVIAMILGVIWALISGQLGWNKFTNDWINPFGVIFINLLKFIAVPLVLFSIITGVASFGDPRKLGKLGGKTLLLYLGTTVLAVSIGLTLVNIIKPGVVSNPEKAIENRLTYEVWALGEGHLIKDNKDFIAKADTATLAKVQLKNKLDKASSEYKDLSEKSARASADQGPLQPLVDVVPSNIITALGDGNLMLQVIFFALFFGISISFLPDSKTATLKKFFNEINDVFIYMVNIIMIAAPFFVFCLMAGVLAKMADTPKEMGEIFVNLGMYSLTVVIGLAVLLFGVYPFLMKIFKANITYKGFFSGLSPAQFLAFSTSSSAATLPVTLHCVENNLKVPKVVADFVLPIGATVNMDGTCLYQGVAVIFLAQYHGVDLSLLQQIGIVGTATLASIGAAAVPGAGLILLMLVLNSVGLNPMWIAIILPMDRILDMCRTVINVSGDSTVALIVSKWEEKDLSKIPVHEKSVSLDIDE